MRYLLCLKSPIPDFLPIHFCKCRAEEAFCLSVCPHVIVHGMKIRCATCGSLPSECKTSPSPREYPNCIWEEYCCCCYLLMQRTASILMKNNNNNNSNTWLLLFRYDLELSFCPINKILDFRLNRQT